MSSRVAALLRVQPCPSTLAESHAIYHHLRIQTQGNVTAFKRLSGTSWSSQKSTDCATFYTLLPAALAERTFTVKPVYPDPKQEDPFDIRGLQTRKSYPPARSFECTIEYNTQVVDNRQTFPNLGVLFSSTSPSLPAITSVIAPSSLPSSPSASLASSTDILSSFYSHPYHTHKHDWLQKLLLDLNAPPLLQPGFGTVITDDGRAQATAPNLVERHTTLHPKRKKINAHGLAALHHAAINGEPEPEYIPLKPAFRSAPAPAPAFKTHPNPSTGPTDIDDQTLATIATTLGLDISYTRTPSKPEPEPEHDHNTRTWTPTHEKKIRNTNTNSTMMTRGNHKAQIPGMNHRVKIVKTPGPPTRVRIPKNDDGQGAKDRAG